MTITPNEPAFPLPDVEANIGLTKREYAAIHIMAGLAGNNESYTGDRAAEIALSWADALIDRLNEKPTAKQVTP